jgi:2-acylglycerol O-acyltransferase 2
MLVYIGVWVFSLSSPLVLVGLVYFGFRIAAALMAAAMVAPFLFPPRLIPAAQRFFSHAMRVYFSDFEFSFEGADFPTAGAIGDGPDQRRPVLFCFHTHGVFSQGWAIAYALELFRGVRFLIASALYSSPFFRALSGCTGLPGSAAKAAMTSYMKKQRDLALIPGGFEEATIHCTHADRMYIKQRQGFVKYALQFGYQLVPVYTFGERETFWNAPGLYKFRLWLNSFGLPGIVPWGQWYCPLLPRDVPLKVVVGAPLAMPQIFAPTKEQVDLWHGKYMEAVQALYDKHRRPTDGDLEMW